MGFRPVRLAGQENLGSRELLNPIRGCRPLSESEISRLLDLLSPCLAQGTALIELGLRT